MKSKILLTLAASTLVLALASCGQTTTSSAASSKASDSSATAASSNVASSSTSVAPVQVEHAIEVTKDSHVSVSVSQDSALVGTQISVVAVIESQYLYTVAVKLDGTALTLTPDTINASVFTTSFLMPDKDVTITAGATAITHKVSGPSDIAGAAVVFTDKTGAPLKDTNKNYITSVDATYGDVVYFAPIITDATKFDATKQFGDVKVDGVAVNYVKYVSSGDYYYYAAQVKDADVAITVDLEAATYLSIAYPKNEHIHLAFKATTTQTIAGGYYEAGAKVTFTAMVDAGYGLVDIVGYAYQSQAFFALDYDATTGLYSYTQPTETVYILADTSATSYPIVIGTKNVSAFSVSSITVNGTALAHDDGYNAKFGDVVTFEIYDVSDEKKVSKVTVNGSELDLADAKADGTSGLIFTFTMPACEADIEFETDYDYHDLTITNAAHFSAVAQVIADDGTATDITQAYAGQKVYLKTTEIAATDGKSYVMSAPSVSYKVGDTDTAVTVTLDSKLSEYYFAMPNAAASVTMNEKEAIWKGKAFVGTYYGGRNGNTNYTIQFAEDGTITFDGNATNNDGTVTEGTDTTTIVFTRKPSSYTYTDTVTIKGNDLFVYETEDDDSTIGYYFFSKTGTAKPTAAAYAYTSAKDAYLFSLTPADGVATEYAMYKDSKAYLGVTVTVISGSAWTDAGAKIKVSDGSTVLGVYTVSGSYTKYLTAVAVDAVAGTYTSGTNTMVLDGYGVATLAGVEGTYTVDSATQVSVVTKKTETDGSVTVTTTVITIDTTAKTYTAATPTSVTLPAFAGKTFKGTYEYDYSNDTATLQVVFSTSAQTLNFKLSSDDYSEDDYSFTAVAYTYDSATGIVSFTMNNASGTATAFTLTYDSAANTMKMNEAYGSSSYQSATKKITMKVA